MTRPAWQPKSNTVLSLGAKGQPVTWLQERLQSFGYDVGTIDGLYGYLTEDCVCSLQREFGLKPDGIAGSAVFELLQDDEVANRRHSQSVANDSMLIDIAQEYDVPLETIKLWNPALMGSEKIKGGSHLILHRLALWGGMGGHLSGGGFVSPHHDSLLHLDGLVVYHHRLTGEGDVVDDLPKDAYSFIPTDITLIPAISNLNQELYDAQALEALLRRRSARHGLIEITKRVAKDGRYGGIALDLHGVELGYGRRFAALVGEVQDILRNHGKRLYMTLVPSSDGTRLFPKYVDRRVWTTLPHRIILQVSQEYIAGEPGPRLGLDWLQAQIRRVQAHLTTWRLMVALPLGGIAWVVGESPREYNYLSYDDVRKLAYEKRAKPQWDAVAKVPYYDYRHAEERVRVWYENRDSVEAKLTWLSRQHITGVVLMPLGWEDARIWQFWK